MKRHETTLHDTPRIFLFISVKLLMPCFTPALGAAEWEILDRFTVNGKALMKSTVTIESGQAQDYALGVKAPSGNFMLYITTGGRVGVGTTNPQAVFEAAGGIKPGTAAVCNWTARPAP